MPEYGDADTHYPIMPLDDICSIPVASWVEDDAVLFLWATSPLVESAFAVLHAWGFTYKASFVWDKVRHNYGHYNSVRHEFLLVATRGSCLPDNPKLIDSVQTIERTGKHSEKPEEFRKIIETMYPNGSRLELFARGKHEGWSVWGQEAK
jgi:N6-adenosine-specific RNA methylase IME4